MTPNETIAEKLLQEIAEKLSLHHVTIHKDFDHYDHWRKMYKYSITGTFEGSEKANQKHLKQSLN